FADQEYFRHIKVPGFRVLGPKRKIRNPKSVVHVVTGLTMSKSSWKLAAPGPKTPILRFPGPIGDTVRKDLAGKPHFQSAVHQFTKGELAQFIDQHQSVFLKDERGVGGGNITNVRIQNIDGQKHLTLQSSNPGVVNAAIRLGAAPLESKVAEKTGNPERPVVLGPWNADRNKALKILAETLAHNAGTRRFNFRNGFYAEAEIPHLKIQGKPLEVRYVIQKQKDGAYKVMHHFAKIGKLPFASNITQGGKMADTRESVQAALQEYAPTMDRADVKALAQSLVDDGAKLSEKLMDVPKKMMRDDAPGFFSVKDMHVASVPSILATVDVVFSPRDGKLEPHIMETHQRGTINLAKKIRDGTFPAAVGRRMLALQEFNLKRIAGQLRPLLKKPVPRAWRRLASRRAKKTRKNYSKRITSRPE
ncbi:MAG: hypothetical protein Q8P02_00825, partial [Candidatus Micrarchaeota archaeon]|nr:hypothetical protein [Candidatus Micrarchaeota archaeon]